MDLLNTFKNNWAETRENFEKFWRGEDIGRPVLFIKSPKKRGFVEPKVTDMNEKWVDIDAVINRHRYLFAHTAYAGETIPYLWPKLGPGSFAAFLGAVPLFMEDTVWLNPGFPGIEEVEISLSENSKWFEWSTEFTKRAISEAHGQFLVGIPDLIENLDTIASLIGTDKLLYSMIDAPREIHRIQKLMLPLWCKAYDAHYELTKDEEGWSIFAGFNMWGKGRTAKLQCDVSAMISRDMFDEFVMPYLKPQCEYLDNVIYHLDGPAAVRHLDSILTIDAIDCLQWSPGDGNPDGGDPCWDEIFKKALNAGKRIDTYMEPELIPDFIKRFGTRGVFIMTNTSCEEEAAELVESLSVPGIMI